MDSQQRESRGNSRLTCAIYVTTGASRNIGDQQKKNLTTGDAIADDTHLKIFWQER